MPKKSVRMPAHLLSGTRTYHLPIVRSQDNPPRATLLIARGEVEGTFEVGLTVCSLGDTFVKAEGQKWAYKALTERPIIGTPDEIRTALVERLSFLEANRPGTISTNIIFDLGSIVKALPDRFEKMEKAIAGYEARVNSLTA